MAFSTFKYIMNAVLSRCVHLKTVFFHAPHCSIINAVLEVMLLKESDFQG